MPSLNTILKLKAGVRATAQARLFARVKNEKHSLRKEKLPDAPDPSAAAPPGARPSFVNSFASSFYSSTSSTASCGAAAALDLKHGKDRGLTASEAVSRVFATPSVHGPLRQSSHLQIDGSDPGWMRGLSEKVTLVIPRQRPEEVLGEAITTNKTSSNSNERLSSKRLEKDPRCALSSLRHDVWKEKRWSGLGSEFKEEVSKRAFLAEFNKNFIEIRGERMPDHREDGSRTRIGLHEETVEKRDKSEELSKTESVEATGIVDGLNRLKRSEKTGLGRIGVGKTGGVHRLKNRLVAVRLFNGTAIVPRVGVLLTRSLHEVSLAGEGMPVDRSSEHESGGRQSDQSASDGKSLKLLSGACNLPHPDKVKTGGEDAYFICSDKQVVGVADGVGGWADLGIDAGEYARELMSQSMIAVHQEPLGCVDPARVMEKAHSMTKCRGSSTACILALTDSVLAAANLGDSGFVIVRNSRTIFKSPVQQHQFNIPFQLECGGSDPPSSAQVFSLPVALGDIIVAGTDGLFDNLYDNELTTVVVQAVRGGMAPQVTAQKIADLARSRAQDKNRQTPFSTAAQDAGYRFYGGKMDDITVIVSYLTNSKSGNRIP